MMEKWEISLRLQLRRLYKSKVGFSFEWKAWLLAYEHSGGGPEEFAKLSQEQQIMEVIYGAAIWHSLKTCKRVSFNYDRLSSALLKASKADNLKLVQAMNYAMFPDWLRNSMSEGDKKKDES